MMKVRVPASAWILADRATFRKYSYGAILKVLPHDLLFFKCTKRPRPSCASAGGGWHVMTRLPPSRRAKKPKEPRIDIWMPLEIRDFHSEAAMLDLEQIGVLTCMKVAYWSGGPLPNDEKMLANIARVSVKRWSRDFAPALMRFFTIGDDGKLHHARLDAEMVHARGISQIRRDAANNRHGNSDRETPQEAEQPSTEAADTQQDAMQVHVQMHIQNTPQMDVQKGAQMQTHARVALHPHEQLKKDSDTTYRAQDDVLPPQKIPIDVRGELWTDGLALLRAITGRADGYSRAFLGRLLKSAGDNAATVMRALRDAASLRPADPEAWLTAACRPQGGGADGGAVGGLSKRKIAMLRAAGLTAADADGGLKCL